MKYLKINSLPANTHLDKDEIMLHACFQLLEDYVTKEKPEEILDKDFHNQFFEEINELCGWWQDRKKFIFIFSDHDERDDEMLLRLIKIRTSLLDLTEK